jgi:hypothetical protein
VHKGFYLVQVQINGLLFRFNIFEKFFQILLFSFLPDFSDFCAVFLLNQNEPSNGKSLPRISLRRAIILLPLPCYFLLGPSVNCVSVGVLFSFSIGDSAMVGSQSSAITVVSFSTSKALIKTFKSFPRCPLLVNSV